jgi:hypothetical protein
MAEGEEKGAEFNAKTQRRKKARGGRVPGVAREVVLALRAPPLVERT